MSFLIDAFGLLASSRYTQGARGFASCLQFGTPEELGEAEAIKTGVGWLYWVTLGGYTAWYLGFVGPSYTDLGKPLTHSRALASSHVA